MSWPSAQQPRVNGAIVNVQQTPCGNCPFRRDAPLAHWHKSHFERLSAYDEPHGPLLACHGWRQQPTLCAGWVIDQLRRNVPNLSLRLFAMSSDDRLGNHADGLELYDSIEQMCEANYPGGRWRPRQRGKQR